MSWRMPRRRWTEMEMELELNMDNMTSRRKYRSQPAYIFAMTKHAVTRHFRIILLGALVAVNLTLFIIQLCKTPHHAPFVAPTASSSIVHGKHVIGLPEPSYPLAPFPDSPMRWPAVAESDAEGQEEVVHRERAPWLAAVISAASDVERRMLIRSSWMRLYRDVPFDGRFVVSNPGPQWTDTVRLENSTFGDMIVLDHLQEDDITANTIKTIEMYQWLIDQGHKYEFVSKMDTDVFFNARGFWDRYLTPRMSNRTGHLTAEVHRTVIGELYYSSVYDLAFPHGAMYTFTWDMVELFASLQHKHQVVTGEDMTLAMLLLKSREVVNFVNFRGTEKFDFDPLDTRGDGTAWARERTHPEAGKHALYGTDAIAVHELKSEDNYLLVSDCFDEGGVMEEPPMDPDVHVEGTPFALRWHDFWDSLKMSQRYESKIDRVPDFVMAFKNGTWRCDDIWDMGKERTGFQ